MKFLGLDPWMIYLLGALVVIEVGALVLHYYLKAAKGKGDKEGQVAPLEAPPVGKPAVLREIGRLRAGGELDHALLRSLEGEDKALFEVALIDALTELPRELQHPLRAALVKHGYDEHCARRLMKGEISDRVRASTLLDLLRPQSHTIGHESEGSKPDHHLRKVRSARSGGGIAGPEA